MLPKCQFIIDNYLPTVNWAGEMKKNLKIILAAKVIFLVTCVHKRIHGLWATTNKIKVSWP